MLRVGLTGGIACGKTHVLRRLAARGCRTLDLDLAARAVVAPGSPALAEIEAAFGDGVLQVGGWLDRAALASLVFADPKARARLNGIVHPRVRAIEASWAAAEPERADGVLVTDAALLVEAGAHLRFDRLVVVHCDPGLQLARLRARDGLDEKAARARIEAQMEVAEKRAYAHFEIDSSGTPLDTERAADAVFDAVSEELRRLAGRARVAMEPPVQRLLGGLVHGPRVGPRGVSPADLLYVASEQGGLELEVLAARLAGAADGPWYRAARQAPPGAPAASLSAALVAWALADRAPDPDFLVAAAASLARLTHDAAAPRAEACLFALLLQEVALLGGIPPDLEARARVQQALAARWGGGAASAQLVPVFRASLRHPEDPAAARAAAAATGGDPALAGALVGVARGASAGEAPELAAALGRIAARRRQSD